jgi:hypothetical protein
MSQENVEVVRRAFDGAGARSIEQTAETFWHPDITYPKVSSRRSCTAPWWWARTRCR